MKEHLFFEVQEMSHEEYMDFLSRIDDAHDLESAFDSNEVVALSHECTTMEIKT